MFAARFPLPSLSTFRDSALATSYCRASMFSFRRLGMYFVVGVNIVVVHLKREMNQNGLQLNVAWKLMILRASLRHNWTARKTCFRVS